MGKWTLEQRNALFLIPKITAPFSILGSALIIIDIVRSPKKLGRTYSRLLLGMSIFDLSWSIAAFLTTWPMPVGTPGAPHAMGTTATCTAQGFFYQLGGLGAPLYNCSLSFFYLFVIAFAWNDATMKRVEWFLHGVPLVLSIVIALVGLPLTLYNPNGLWCMNASLPQNCENGGKRDGVGECERGHNAWLYKYFFVHGPVWFCILLVTGNMLAVVYLVWNKERASKKFKFRGSSATVRMSDNSTNNNNQQPPRRSTLNFWRRSQAKPKKKEKPGLSNQVAWQAFYYVGAFMLTYLPSTLHRIRVMMGIENSAPFPLAAFITSILPLQGFFNWLIYIRPKVNRYLRRNPKVKSMKRWRRKIGKSIKKMFQCFSCCNASPAGMDETAIEPSSDFDTPSEEDTDEDPAHALQVQKNCGMDGSGMRNIPEEEVPIADNDDLEKNVTVCCAGGGVASKSVAFTDDDNSISSSEKGSSRELLRHDAEAETSNDRGLSDAASTFSDEDGTHASF